MKSNFASHPKSKFWSTRNEVNLKDYSLYSHNTF